MSSTPPTDGSDGKEALRKLTVPPLRREWPADIGTPKEMTGTENMVAAKWLCDQTALSAWAPWDPESGSSRPSPEPPWKRTWRC